MNNKLNECKCQCHLASIWEEIDGVCIHCKPTQQSEDNWEEIRATTTEILKEFKRLPEIASAEGFADIIVDKVAKLAHSQAIEKALEVFKEMNIDLKKRTDNEYYFEVIEEAGERLEKLK